METRKEKYSISAGALPVFLALMLLFLFCAIGVKLSGNLSAEDQYLALVTNLFVYGMIAISAVLVFLTAHRMIYFHVRIYEDGFFYQTRMNNGTFYKYAELERAWITSGKDMKAQGLRFCNFETADGKITRIQLTGSQEEAAQYLVKRTQEETGRDMTQDNGREYIIDGKDTNLVELAFSVFVLMIAVLAAAAAFRAGFIGILFGIFYLFVLGRGVAMPVLFDYFFFQIRIDEKGFFYQTNPVNGKYYLYEDVSRCWEEEKERRRRSGFASGSRHSTTYTRCFCFLDPDGKTKRFYYAKYKHGQEVEILKERIRGCAAVDGAKE